MEFEGPIYQSDGVTLMVDSSGRFAKIGRLTVDILGYHAWAGNWCWDRISVAWPEALKIINYLGSLEKQGWHMSCGPTELFDAFNARHAITPAEWKANNEQRHATR
jgi:hypothetical protein